jgi:hypothetical protein
VPPVPSPAEWIRDSAGEGTGGTVLPSAYSPEVI